MAWRWVLENNLFQVIFLNPVFLHKICPRGHCQRCRELLQHQGRGVGKEEQCWQVENRKGKTEAYLPSSAHCSGICYCRSSGYDSMGMGCCHWGTGRNSGSPRAIPDALLAPSVGLCLQDLSFMALDHQQLFADFLKLLVLSWGLLPGASHSPYSFGL